MKFILENQARHYLVVLLWALEANLQVYNIFVFIDIYVDSNILNTIAVNHSKFRIYSVLKL